METKVRYTVKKIFEELRKTQPKTRSRKSDRVNVEQILNEFNERSSGQKIDS